MQTTYRGIDYGLGRTNINRQTGIRYGVISQNTVGQAWFDSSEPDFGQPTCPECGGPAVTRPSRTEQCATGVAIILDDEKREGYRPYGSDPYFYFDYACDHCKLLLSAEHVYSEEPIGWNYEGDGYTLHGCLDTDIMVLRSPFKTRAQFCSPCVPGACNLDSPCPDGEWCYCLGHEWFEDGKAPYPVFNVDTGDAVHREK